MKTMMQVLFLGLLASVAAVHQGAYESALEAAWSQDQTTPIKRVVNLLNKMKSELEAEAAQEAEMYDKMVCWCETNEKEKTKAISDAEAKDSDLSSEIEARAAQFGERATEIARLKSQIAEDNAALKEATALREKQAGSFSATERELMQSVTNVKNAIEVLSKHNSAASFTQMDAPVMSSMRAVLRDLAFKHEMIVADSQEKGRKMAFLQRAASAQGTSATSDSLLSALDAQGAASASTVPLDIAQKILERSVHEGAALLQSGAAPSSGSYAPQSGAIFGILKQLKEDFESNMSQEQKDEMTAKEDFENLARAKKAQISSGSEKLDVTEGDHADNQKALSDAKEDLELTRDQRSKDVEFLRNLKQTCRDLDSQWAQRSKTRATETTAVSEAISIITDDDNMDHLRNTPTTLLQVAADSSSEMRMRRNRAVASLRKAAEDPFFATDDLMAAWHSRKGPVMSVAGSPRTQLSTLAVTASLDSFTKIKKAMDTMTADLKEEQVNEVKFKAHCDKEFDATDQDTFRKNEEKDDLQNTIEKLTKLQTKLSGEIDTERTQTADTETAIKKASQVREAENAEFQTTVADQRATQVILKKALGKLTEFYKKAFLLQKSSQEPPVKFNTYGKNAGASPVIGMIEQIIGDSAKLESEAVAGETEAQRSYETFVKDSNAQIAQLTTSVSKKTKARATAKMSSSTAQGDLESTVGELQGLAEYEADLHADCDFVLKNFEVRQKARMDEMEAIQQAKAILSGMK